VTVGEERGRKISDLGRGKKQRRGSDPGEKEASDLK